MKISKWIAVAVLACCAQVAQGQCQPTNSPTIGMSVGAIKPSQMTLAAVTLNVSNTGGSNASGNLIAGAGTNLQLNWHAYNFDVLTISYQIDNGSYTTWGTNLPSSGYAPFTLLAAWAGHSIHLLAVATEIPGSGAGTPQTQDVANVIVTSQAPAIYSADQTPDNEYVLVTTSYSGNPNIPYQTTCTNAAEKPMYPQANLQVWNTFSGETRNGLTMNGNTVVVGTPVNATAFDWISTRTGDSVGATTGGVTYCTVLGNFWNKSTMQDIEFEVAFTASYVSSLVKSNGWHPEAYYCSDRTSPPDWVGPFEANPATTSGEYWGAEFLYREVPWGQSFKNVPWLEAFSFIAQPKIVPPNATAPDCTNYDKGFQSGKQVFFPGPFFS